MSIVDSIDYTKILPMAVESRVRRRGYVPSNGASFVNTQNNVIEIPISASAFLDTRHSALRFTLLNTSGTTFGVDYGGGHSFWSRIRVLQGGVVLSDCRSYNRLMSAIVLPCQGDQSSVSSRSISEGVRYANSAPGGAAGGVLDPADFAAGASANAEVTGACFNTPTNAVDSTVAAAPGSSHVFTIPIMNGLLGTTQEKLVPLFLLNSSPIVLELTIDTETENMGTWGAAPAGITINNVRYLASLVETGPAVEEQIRMVQANSQGRLVLNGVDFTHQPGQLVANTLGRVSIPIPVRKKSIKSVLFVGSSNAFGGGVLKRSRYNLSHGGHLNMVEYQLSFGARRIPEMPIRFVAALFGSARNSAEYFEELAKCFGTTKSAHGLGVMSRINTAVNTGLVGTTPAASAGGAAMASHTFCPYGIDCEAFQPDGKGGGALESGIDTATTSTPLYLNIDIGPSAVPINENINIDMYVVHDSLYYIDQVGNIRIAQ